MKILFSNILLEKNYLVDIIDQKERICCLKLFLLKNEIISFVFLS